MSDAEITRNSCARARESLQATIGQLSQYSDALETENERLRRALREIAWNDGGWCGDKAREALHP